MSINEKQLSKLLYYFSSLDGGVYPSGKEFRYVMNMREENKDYINWVRETFESFTGTNVYKVPKRGNRKPLLCLM